MIDINGVAYEAGCFVMSFAEICWCRKRSVETQLGAWSISRFSGRQM